MFKRLFAITIAVTSLGFGQQSPVVNAVSSAAPAVACASVVSNGTAVANFMAKFTSACNVGNSMVFDTGTKVGLGTTSPGASFDVLPPALTGTTGSLYGVRAYIQYKPTSNNTSLNYAVYADALSVSGSPFTFSQLHGLGFAADHLGTGTVSSLVAGAGAATNRSTGTVTSAIGLQVSVNNVGAGAVTTGYGIKIGAPQNSGGGSIGSYYGVYISSPSAAGAKFGLYSEGGTNFFGGFVGIGTSTPTASLEVAGSVKLTGTGNGITFPDGTMQKTANGAGSGTGTVSGVTAGTGLTGGGTSGKVTLAADAAYFTSHYLALTGTAANATNLGGIAASTLAARSIGYMAGCDSCGALTTSDSQIDIYMNMMGTMSVVSVTCFSDAGAPTVNIRRNRAGTLTNLLKSNLACSTSGAATTAFTASPFLLNASDRLNLVMATVDGKAKRVTIMIKTLLQ